RRWPRAVRLPSRLHALLAVCGVGAIASTVDAGLRMHGGAGLDRVYYGTDTRASGLLVGASLAVGLAMRSQQNTHSDARRPSRLRRGLCFAAPVAALAAVLAMMHSAGSQSVWLYPYGLFGLDVAVATIIAAVVLVPHSPAARVLSLRPIRAIGLISYGI